MWPLAGLALGGLLGSLFMGHGMGSALLAWLAVGVVIMLVRNFFRNKMQPAREPLREYNNPYRAQENVSPFMSQASFSAANKAPVHPIDFDEPAFLRDAKVQFIRLQAAFDQKNLDDLREFTTPEVFAEIKLQLQERGDAENKTDVVNVNAELMDVTPDFQKVRGAELQSTLASVRFSGMIQEKRNEPAAPFNEIWHFRKDVGNQWLVAGLQQ
jgi:predicted lipid-binding transport protein (Tim44 family)